MEVIYAKNTNESMSFSVELSDEEVSVLKKSLKKLETKARKPLSRIIKEYETMKEAKNSR